MPAIHIKNPYKECHATIGMRQSGKTNFEQWLLSTTTANYVLFNTIGSIPPTFRPLNPKTQRVVTPPNWETIIPTFEKTAKDVWSRGNTMFIIDDISVRHGVKGKLKPFFTDKYWMHPMLAKMMNQGGNRNISLSFTAQRVAQVHNDLLSNCKHHFVFKLYLPQDIDWYAQVIGRETAEASQALEDYSFIYKMLGSPSQVMKPVKRMN